MAAGPNTGVSAPLKCGFEGDLGGFGLGKIGGLQFEFDSSNDCVLYALCACLIHYKYVCSPLIISTLQSYLTAPIDSVPYSGHSLSMGRVVSIIESYFYGNVVTKSAKLRVFDIPCLCRVGYEGGIGGHVVLIYQNIIYSLDSYPLIGQTIYDCREIILCKKQ